MDKETIQELSRKIEALNQRIGSLDMQMQNSSSAQNQVARGLIDALDGVAAAVQNIKH